MYSPIPPEPLGSERILRRYHGEIFEKITMEIKQIRQQVRSLRTQLSNKEQKAAAHKIANTLLTMEIYKSSSNIACYYSYNNEVDASPIIENCWQANKKCFLPVVNNESLQFVRYLQNTKLVKNRYHILEPANTDELIAPVELDLIIVPLIAFDQNCNRIGSGAGFYDRTFAFKKTHKRNPSLIGLAYELQKVENFNVNQWDIPLDYVITPRSVYQRS